MNRAMSQSDSDDFYAIKPAMSGNEMGWDVAVHRHGKARSSQRVRDGRTSSVGVFRETI